MKAPRSPSKAARKPTTASKGAPRGRGKQASPASKAPQATMPSEQYGQFVMPHGYAPHGYVMMGNFVPAPMHGSASDTANGDRAAAAGPQQHGTGFMDASRSFYIAAAPPTHGGDASQQKGVAGGKQGGATAPAPAAFLDPSGRNIIFAPAPMMWRTGSAPAQGGLPQPGPVFTQHGYMKGFHNAQHTSHSNMTGMSTWDSAPAGTLPPLSESAPPPPESAPVATATTTSAGGHLYDVHANISEAGCTDTSRACLLWNSRLRRPVHV